MNTWLQKNSVFSAVGTAFRTAQSSWQVRLHVMDADYYGSVRSVRGGRCGRGGISRRVLRGSSGSFGDQGKSFVVKGETMP